VNKSKDKSTVVCQRGKELEKISCECPVEVPIPATGDKTNSPAYSLETGTNHLNIVNLTLSE